MKVLAVLIIVILGGVTIGFSQTQVEDTVVYDIVDSDAEFPKEYGFINQWIGENFEFIDKPKKSDIGLIYVKFCIELDGSVSKISIRKGISKNLDESVLKMMSKMPKWKPVMNNGKAVRSRFTLPIQISI